MDNLRIEERTAQPALLNLSAGAQSIDVSWLQSALNVGDFGRYHLERKLSSASSSQWSVIAEISDVAQTSFADTGLSFGESYDYRLRQQNANGTYSDYSSVLSETTTLGTTAPEAESFEVLPENYVFTGNWGLSSAFANTGSFSLTDSPGGNHASNNEDSYALVRLDTSGLSYPVLRFWTRYDLGSSTYASVEISTNGGQDWSDYWRRGSNTGADLGSWTEQVVFLPADNADVWIRFDLDVSSSTSGDGWYIDDLTVTEESSELTGVSSYPLLEDFESGVSGWLVENWSVQSDNAFAGSGEFCGLSDVARWPQSNGVWNEAIYKDRVDLRGASDPQLTLMLREIRDSGSYDSFRVYVRRDGETEATEVLNTSNIPENWTQYQVDLNAFAGNLVELSLVTEYGKGVCVDNLGIGDPGPSAPTPVFPAPGQVLNTIRPTLTIANSFDAQGDFISHYTFEVYSDESLDAQNLVAEVPIVRPNTGAATTSWQVDVDLDLEADYYWRARATDELGNGGIWMQLQPFALSVDNQAPTAPQAVRPTESDLLASRESLLVWLASVDLDPADEVAAYDLEFSGSMDFTAPLLRVNDVTAPGDLSPLSLTNPASTALGTVSIALSSLDTEAALPQLTDLYWRVRARDSLFAFSDWSETALFQIGTGVTGQDGAHLSDSFEQRLLELAGQDPNNNSIDTLDQLNALGLMTEASAATSILGDATKMSEYGLYSEQSMGELLAPTPLIFPIGDTIRLQIQLEESSDLIEFSPVDDPIMMDLPISPDGAAFYRFSVE